VIKGTDTIETEGIEIVAETGRLNEVHITPINKTIANKHFILVFMDILLSNNSNNKSSSVQCRMSGSCFHYMKKSSECKANIEIKLCFLRFLLSFSHNYDII